MSVTTRRLLALVLLGQVLDAATFVLVITLYPWAIEGEQNPLVLLSVALGGVLLIPLIKVGAAALMAWMFGWSRWRRPAWPRPIRLLLVGAVASGFLGFAANTFSLIQIKSMGL